MQFACAYWCKILKRIQILKDSIALFKGITLYLSSEHRFEYTILKTPKFWLLWDFFAGKTWKSPFYCFIFSQPCFLRVNSAVKKVKNRLTQSDWVSKSSSALQSRLTDFWCFGAEQWTVMALCRSADCTQTRGNVSLTPCSLALSLSLFPSLSVFL